MDDLASRVRELEDMRDAFLDSLSRLSDAMASTHDRQELIGSLLRTTASYLGAASAVFYVSVAGSDRLRALDSVGVDGKLADLEAGEGLAGSSALAHDVALWPEGRDGRQGASPCVREPGGQAGTALAMPVRSGSKPFGVLAYYGRDRPRPYDRADIATLAALIRQAEIAIDSSFVHEEARRLSLTDGLTGLWNHRHLALRIETELSRAVRFGEPFSVLYCDLDGFKRVNDTHGHQAGDTVLIETARRLIDATREVDIVARPGGDEFALLLPRTGLAGAMRLADKVRVAVGRRPYEIDTARVPVSISIGVATYPEHGSSGKALLAAADEALYRAKQGGRDRAEHAHGQPSGGGTE